MNKEERKRLDRIEEKLDKIIALLEPDLTMTHPPLEVPQHTIISCDASIKTNPGGPSSVGFVIRRPNEQPMIVAKPCPATTNNQAEYDAVYEALTTLFNLVNNPGKVEVRSDSKLVIDQLNGEMECHDKTLAKRRDAIREFVKALPVEVTFTWRPRNSTPDLETANYRAQEILGVSPH